MKTRALDRLPVIQNWEEYLVIGLVAEFPVTEAEDLLTNYYSGKRLLACKTVEAQTFRLESREFIDRLVFVLAERVSTTSSVSRALSHFCLKILLEGDNNAVFGLFSDKCRILRTSGVLSLEESNSAMEEFSSLVIEKRNLYEGPDQAASGIPDIVNYLLRDFIFQSGHRLLRAFEICCLIVGGCSE